MLELVDIRDAFFDELYQIAKDDVDVVFMAADMGAFSLERFRRDFPDRFINVGISEQNLISSAAGLALAGKKVFVYAIIPFVTLRCLEQIKVDLCVMNLPVTVVGAGSGFTYSNDGPTHHAIEDVSIMRALPGMTIFNPSDQIKAQAAAQSAYKATGPVYIRLDKGVWPILNQVDSRFSNGMAYIRKGTRFLIIATGSMTHVSLRIADSIEASGICVGVVDLFQLKPVTKDLAEVAKEYKFIVTLEEHTLPGGMGGAVVEFFADEGLMIPVKRLGIPNVYPEGYGDRDCMLRTVELDINSISAKIIQLNNIYQEAFDKFKAATNNIPAESIACKPKEVHHQHFISDFDSGEDHDWLVINQADFEKLTGLPVPSEAAQLISTLDLRYRLLTQQERDNQILKILRILDEPLVVSGPKRLEAWEKGWGQNLHEFITSGYQESALLPYYYRRGRTVMRFCGDYILPHSELFEASCLQILQLIISHAYFQNVPAIFEFGCGPGHNLLAFSRSAPGKIYHGLDWAKPSSEILNLADAHFAKTDLHNHFLGSFIDLFNPQPELNVIPGSAFLTFGSMEQLGDKFKPLFDYMIEQPASIYIHFEPFSEFRNQDVLTDVLADRYATKRGYLRGYLDHLRAQAKLGVIEIINERKILGSTFYDGWCLVVWRRL